MTRDPFVSTTFSAPDDRCELVSNVMLKHVPERGAISVLDIGCGTGNLLFHLAHRLPMARLTGVDVSEPNIAAAVRRRAELGLEGRVQFQRSDYLAPPRDVYDAIVSDSTLQYIVTDTVALFRTLEADLRPDGILMVNMPYVCPYNRLLWFVRRLLRAISGPAADRLIFTAAKLLHGQTMADPLLWERVRYMYLLPLRAFSTSLYEEISRTTRLRLMETQRLPHASLAQPRHELAVFRKASTPATVVE